jgi:hypothetical protein
MANRKTNAPAPEAPLASPPVTLTPEALQAVIAQAVAEATAKLREEMQIAKPAAGKSDQSAKNAWAAQKAFVKAGYKDVRPNETIKTYNRWLAEGRKVKEGEHAVKVKNLRLFHVSQTELASAEAVAANKAKIDGAVARKAKVIPIGEAHPQ